ncbi:hypothetical protein [Methylococcus capsulatus]|uniref:hypothetical protein n=1 Tax=Methylococcus capsulatus TaxID=414 RepID=UPI001C530A18|nr:hypothetical protein [Methylococcus capsulatus]QXP89496.1 hypothetical protein KW114_10270 [Methylococcus capsulatus]
MFKDAVAIGGFLFFCALAILFGMTCFSGKSDGAFFVAVACAVIALRFLGIGRSSPRNRPSLFRYHGLCDKSLLDRMDEENSRRLRKIFIDSYWRYR